MIVSQISSFKQKIDEGFVVGVFSKTSDPSFIEILGHAGYDFVIIDLEHGPNSVSNTQHLIRAAETGGILPVVRTKENNMSMIGEVLDIGAGGIQVPQITLRKGAEEAISNAKFAPLGSRGVCRFVRAARFSAMDRYEYFRQANEAVVILQIEGRQALENIDAIISVPGIDIIFIGPYDLSQSLGIPGQVDHPLIAEKVKEMIAVCSKKNIAVGTFVDTIEHARKWRDAGIKYLAYSVDVGIFYEGCNRICQLIKSPSC